MNGPRAADDFATIRSRMEELRQVTRPRAADDFAVIRARVEELRPASVLKYRPTRRGVRRLGQGPIIGRDRRRRASIRSAPAAFGCASFPRVERRQSGSPHVTAAVRPKQQRLNFLPLPQGQGSLRPTPRNGL